MKSTVLLSILFLLQTIESVIIRDYNYVHYEDFESYDDFKRQFLYHDPSRPDVELVKNNLFLGVANNECKADLESPAFRGAQRHGGGNVLSVQKLILCTSIFMRNIHTHVSPRIQEIELFLILSIVKLLESIFFCALIKTWYWRNSIIHKLTYINTIIISRHQKLNLK